jgi:hypothetical protein
MNNGNSSADAGGNRGGAASNPSASAQHREIPNAASGAAATVTITETETETAQEEVLQLTLRARPSVTWYVFCGFVRCQCK